MVIMLGSFVVFRQIYLFVTYQVAGTLLPVALGYPVGWVVCSGCSCGITAADDGWPTAW